MTNPSRRFQPYIYFLSLYFRLLKAVLKAEYTASMSAFHEHQLVNSTQGILDPLPSLRAPSTRMEFPNTRSSVKSQSAVRTISFEPAATPIAYPKAKLRLMLRLRGIFAILFRFFLLLLLLLLLSWQQGAKVIDVIVPAT